MKQYELLYALPGELTDAELKGRRERVDALIKAAGTVSLNDYAGKIKLAYPVGAHRYGHYVVVRFSAEPAAIAKLDADLRLENDVIRHMLVSADEVAPTAVVRLQAREEETRAPEAAAPTQAPAVPAAAPLSAEDIDKKIDEMLTEAVK